MPAIDILQEEIKNAVEILKRGGIIAFPTDTVYGLGCNAFDITAVDRIYQVKRRPRHLSLPLLLNNISQLSILTEPISEFALFLAGRFWPGGLTLVLSKSASLPKHLSSQSTVAVRIPDHTVPMALIQGLGKPIIGTSANINSQPNTLTVDEVNQQLGDNVDLIIDGGKCTGNNESTIVDVTGKVPIILRQGIVPQYEIKSAFEEYCEVSSDAYCSGL